ncbi:threonine/homoserine/homoserine lactone efflux protein [Kutzneria viridogrisea]|uniref:Threonine/homoserine/homoserine lactone efflux protein n=1 Tax=Kutzneria viridogrisea TaxID=47990 RepID=A0ABR6BKZ1_9PSEU|nr:threonine/homoserine/homoserine lactone efflux protein [Kutzneria viridogrisea]
MLGDVLVLGVLLGVGAALSVGPIFVTILHEAATRGFGASMRVVLGSAVADLVLLLPALALSQVIAAIAGASRWVGLVGAVFLLGLAGLAGRDARRLWGGQLPEPTSGWAFWKGVLANLVNPLTWTFWLVTGTPAMLGAQRAGGVAGLVLFTVTWFVVASGLEGLVALGVARSGRRIGPRGQGVLSGLSALVFLGLAGVLLATTVLAA